MFRCKVLAGVMLAAATVTHGQFATNWVAFNDHNTSLNPAPTTGPNVTLYNLGGVLPAGAPAGSVVGGPLTNQLTGQELTATLTVTWTGGDGPDNFGASTDANPGTPADLLFANIVDVGGAGAGTDEGIVGLRNSEQNVVSITFSNLDTSQRYLFRGTSIRGNNYNDRWGVYTISASSFVDAHVDASPNLNIFTADTFPNGGLSPGQVALNSGENRVGSLVGWNDIVPNPDGTITITEQQFVGTAPFGNPSAGPYGYGMNAIMLAEIFSGPPSAPRVVTEPTPVDTVEGQVATLRAVATGTPPLLYQWYQGTPPNGLPIPGAIRPTFNVTNINGSGKAWSVPADSGTYYVTINGALAPAATSTAVRVDVRPDTVPPRLVQVTCTSTNPSLLFVQLSEAIENGDTASDPFNWNLVDAQTGALIESLTADYVNGSTTVTVTLQGPRDPARAYVLNYLGEPLIDRSAAANRMITPASIPITCIESELVPLTAQWRYLDNDIEPASNWKDAGFDDSSWSTGIGPFDAKRAGAGVAGADCRDVTLYNLGNVGTCLRLTSPVTQTNLITSYFRSSFHYGASPSGTVLLLNGKFDDGAVIYLNGTELQRVGMPASPAPVGHTTLAPRGVGDTDPQDTFRYLSPAALRQGENQLAISLHQNSLTSSDLTMGLRIVSLSQTPLTAAGPRLTITREGSSVRIRWTPVVGTLQSTDSLSAAPVWQDQTTGQVAPGDYLIPASELRRFFSIRQ